MRTLLVILLAMTTVAGQNNSIHVRVYDVLTYRPVPGALVSLGGSQDWTDLDGYAVFPYPGPQALVTVNAQGYCLAARQEPFHGAGGTHWFAVVPLNALTTPIINPAIGGVFDFPGRGQIIVPPGALRFPCRIGFAPFPPEALMALGLELEDVYGEAHIAFFDPSGFQVTGALNGPILLRLVPWFRPLSQAQAVINYRFDPQAMVFVPDGPASSSPAPGGGEPTMDLMTMGGFAAGGSGGGSEWDISVTKVGGACQIIWSTAIICGHVSTSWSIHVKAGDERTVKWEVSGEFGASGGASNENSLSSIFLAKVSGRIGVGLKGSASSGSVTTTTVETTISILPGQVGNPCLTGERQVVEMITIYEVHVNGKSAGTFEVPGKLKERTVGQYDPNCPGCNPEPGTAFPTLNLPDPCQGLEVRK